MKSGCVSGAKMLPRSEMQKIPKDCYGGEAKFTQVQELKQAMYVQEVRVPKDMQNFDFIDHWYVENFVQHS